ncbi:MAG: glycosyl hydrolase family 59 [Oscillospiraceae bacterium]|nr:glycosyl hydrolase family 59 [Oscillospiraceae bacterium]
MENSTNPLAIKPSEIIVDGSTINENPAAAFRGLGCVTGNGSSRLLMDYKKNFPEVYEEILRQLFAPNYGAGLTHIKVEFGADINSSSGTEPCVKRTAEEVPDVTRGAGFMLAADAKRINPQVTADLLRWGEPHWVTEAFRESKEAGFAARYRWFYETLAAAYITYGLTFDYISPDANETDHADTEWLVYFAKALREQENPPYDFSNIKIVASDEVGTRTIAQEMLGNEQLRNAVDVIGLHYTTFGDDNTQLLHDVYGKEIWYSEGIAPCSVPELTCRVDGCGMTGANGPIDTANRIINSYVNGRMVMYEFQPAIAAYYDGACYSPKQLMTAKSPWSGHYSRDIGFWIASHFTRFVKTGWQFVDSACFGDGDENHAIWNTTHNFVTLVSPDRTQMTMHISNDSDVPRSYLVIVNHLPYLPRHVHLVETAGNHNPLEIDQNWFRVIDHVHVTSVKGDMAFPVVVKPHSLLTVTTMDVSELRGRTIAYPDIPQDKRLELPYKDDFSCEDSFLTERGGAPLYTTDQGGAFEIVKTDDGNVLQQMITLDALPTNWRFRGTPDPLTCFGDDKWSNYQGKTRFRFAESSGDNYAALGIRYNSSVTCPESSACGLMLRLYADGRWEFYYMDDVIDLGKIDHFKSEGIHELQIMAIGTLIMAFADGFSVAEINTEKLPMVRSGRMCLQSAYYRNQFLEISADPVPMMIPSFCWRLDCLAPQIRYLEKAKNGWMLNGMADYKFYNRTCAIGDAGSEMEIRFHGSGIFLLGKAKHAVIDLYLDGRLYAEKVKVQNTHFRECFYTLETLSEGWHTVKLVVAEGSLEFDAAEIPTSNPNPVYAPPLPAKPRTEITEIRPANSPSRLAKAAIPLAGAAATGLAVAFTVGAIINKKKKNK